MEELQNPEVQTVEVFAPHHYHPEPHAGLDPDQELDELDEQIKTKIYIDDPFKINSQLIFSMTDEELDPDVVRQNASKKMETVYRPKKWAVSKLNKVKKGFGLGELTVALPDTFKVNDNLITMDIKTSDDKTTNMEFSFFTDGIFKMKCINPANPSKFSFEMVEKPANLQPLNIGNFISKQDSQFEVTLDEAQIRIQVKFNPFNITIFSTKDNDLLFEMNTSKSLKFDENLTADFKFTTPWVYGLPERAHNLLLLDSREELPYRLYNNDLFGYDCDSRQALYGSIPMVVARKQNSPTFTTLFWENTSETYIDVQKEGDSSKTFWLSERGNLEMYVFVNHTAASHYAAIARVTGFAAMPQYFTMGYHQCRYSYNDEQDVLHVNEKFNEHEIPCDSITLDIDHTNGFRYFTWDHAMFPDPTYMQDMLNKDGRKLVCIADPHIRACDDYKVYKGVIEKNLGVQKPDGTVFKGVCFPGDCVWMDFLNEEARDFWGSQYSYENYTHSTPNLFAWNDMNEPSVFELKDKAMPRDNLHTVKNNDEPEKAIQIQHREVHNIYGYCMHKSTYLGLLRRNKDQNIRPHVLSRAFYAGSQKWSTIWTGDTISTWDHLKYTVPMMLSMALCGISFIGGDVGGFLGNPEPELSVRWNQLGSFMPFFRAHCDKRFERREPWLSSKETYQIIKDMIKKKYKFLPFWYTCFEEHCRTGIPVIRPAWFNEGAVTDASLFKEETRFMVGDSLLVVPIFVSGQRSIKGALDGLEGRWYDWFTKKEVFAQDEIQTGLERIGVFVRGGYAIPHFHITPNMKSTRDAKEGDIVLAIGLDKDGNSKGRMYFDDGETFDFRKGVYTNKLIGFSNGKTFTWSDEGGKFGFEPKNKVTKIFLMGLPEGKVKEGHLTTQDGKKQECHVSYTDGHYVIAFSIPAKNDFKIVFE